MNLISKNITYLFIVFSGYTLLAQVGINTDNPQTMLDVNGNLSLNAAPLALNNGNNNVSGGDHTLFNITGPTNSFKINTIQPLINSDGQLITLVNTTSNSMTLVNNDGTGVNSILCPNAKDLFLQGIYTTATLQYNKTLARWIVVRYADGEIYQRRIYSSTGSTDIQTNNSGWKNMEDMRLTFTSKNAVVYLNFGAAGFMYLNPGGNADEQGYGDFRLVNETAGNTVLAGATVIATDVDRSDVGDREVSSSYNVRMNMIPVYVTPGQPTTLKIQWRNGGANARILLCPATNTDYAHRNITIFD